VCRGQVARPGVGSNLPVLAGTLPHGEAIGSVARQPVVKPKRWKLFLLTVAALYPLTLLIPEVLRITSHLIPALREGVVRGILAAALLVASVMFVIIPFCNRVFKKWLNS
jgi:antibiotic biosynthesis monooxygenase (ABM) superfamily enzyme